MTTTPAPTSERTAMLDRIYERELLGHVPDPLDWRDDLADQAGHPASIDAIEDFRHELLHHNTLERRTQQLIHFAMLVATGADEPARIHARAVLEAGGTVADLYGVATTAAVTGGMPAYGRAINHIQHALISRSPQPESELT